MGKMTTEQFSLRWNNFHSNLTSGFHNLLESSEMVDVTLAVEGHIIQAHKIVLSICSPYFRQMFKVNPCKHPIIILKDVAHENMKNILSFMYMGEVNVLRENLETFLRTAEHLQVKGLTGDDSSETSSRKDDDKCDSIDHDEDSDLNQFNSPMDSDLELPSNFNSSVNGQSSQPPQQIIPNYKRPTKHSQSSNLKRVRPDPPAKLLKLEPEKPINTSCNEEEEGESHTNLEKVDLEETKEQLKLLLENNFTNSTSTQDGNLSDHGIKVEGKFGNNIRHTYQCGNCSKKFTRRDHLRTHEKNIHGEDAGPLMCVICQQLYKNTESLRKHLSKFHFNKMNEVTTKVEVGA